MKRIKNNNIDWHKLLCHTEHNSNDEKSDTTKHQSGSTPTVPVTSSNGINQMVRKKNYQ